MLTEVSVSIMQAGVQLVEASRSTQLESGDWRKRTMTWRPNS